MLDRYYYSESPSPLYKKLALSMFGAIVLIGLLGTFALNSNTQDPKLVSILNAEELEFKDFLYTFNKNYKTDSEYTQKFKTFRDNLSYIRVFNSMENTVVLGVNHFADLEFSEFKKIYLPNKLPGRDETDSVSFEGLVAPNSVDWRAKGAVTPVKNQGECGACWSFSTTGSVEGAWFLAGHSLVSLSEQQLVDCSIRYLNKGCDGGTMDRAFRYIIGNKGITSETNYPYNAKDGICNTIKEKNVAATISSYTNVAHRNPNALQNAVAQQPVSIGVDASDAQWQLYKSGTITKNCGTSLDHAVLIVGYDCTGSPAYWIVKNSWGPSWGMAGYIQIEISSGDGVCGINMQPSYPVV